MRTLAAAIFVASVALSFVVLAQSPTEIEYCKALTAAYRKAVAAGEAPVPGIGDSIAGCPTNPVGSIPTLEKAVREVKAEMPKR